MRRSLSITAILVAVFPGVLHAASFDCSKAVSVVEKAICSDRELSGLDDSLAQAYKKALSAASDPEAVKRGQRAWLKSERDVCKDLPCLKKAYTKRLGELNDMLASRQAPPAAGTSASAGAKVQEKKLSKETRTMVIDLSWPEFRFDEYPQTASALTKRIQGDVDKAHKEFLKEASEAPPDDTGRESMKYGLTSSYKLTYNAGGVVSVCMDIYTFMGGAHGSTIQTGYTFDLKSGKFQTLEDFLGRDWQSVAKSKIIPAIKARGGEFFDEPKQGKFDIAPGQFYLTPKGVVVFFQQYEIAPYSTGIPEFIIERKRP